MGGKGEGTGNGVPPCPHPQEGASERHVSLHDRPVTSMVN